MNDNDRFQAMKSHHPDILFMVWDYYENTAIAYCLSMEAADKVAAALESTNTIKWLLGHWLDTTTDELIESATMM